MSSKTLFPEEKTVNVVSRRVVISTEVLQSLFLIHEVIGLFSLVINQNSLENTQVTSEVQTVVEDRLKYVALQNVLSTTNCHRMGLNCGKPEKLQYIWENQLLIISNPDCASLVKVVSKYSQ